MKKIKEFWNKGIWQKLFVILVVVFITGVAINIDNPSSNNVNEDMSIKEIANSILSNPQLKEEDKTLNIYFKIEYKGASLTRNEYFENVRKVSRKIQSNKELDNYEKINFVGNVMEDDKVKCVISGFFTVNQIKTCDDFIHADIEGSLNDLHVPSMLK